MRVGLCACYENHNYGSMLQSLATEVAIGRLGHECEMVRYKKDYSLLQIIKQIPRVFHGGSVQKMNHSIIAHKLASDYPDIALKRKERASYFDDYCKRTFTSLSELNVGFDALCRGSGKYDAVVVGSDQLWLPMGLPTNFYNLKFVQEGVRRISYATSFGVSSIPWYQKTRTADFLKDIDYLSVREESGADICASVANLSAKVVVDPTLLLTGEQWLDVIPGKEQDHEPYILCYFLGTNPLCRNEANAVKQGIGLPIVALKHLDQIVPTDEDFGDESPYEINPEGFVNLIRNAEYVLTDSFHGTVFSVLYHKRFATFYRFSQNDKQSRNSRIDTLLGNLGLENRLVEGEGKALPILKSEIDFTGVDEKLDTWRQESWDFLKGALS